MKYQPLSYVTINAKSVINNHNYFKNLVGDKCTVATVLKSNAYGLGSFEMLEILYNNGCNNFFVAYQYEGEKIRKKLKDKDVQIYILSGFFYEDRKLYKKYNLIPVLNSIAELMMFKKFCQKEKTNFPCAIKVDTGMNRNGLLINEMLEYKSVIIELNTKLIMSHLACSGDKNNLKNKEQLNNFLKIKKEFGSNFKYSLSATCGALLGKEYHFDMIRLGFGLYCDVIKKLKSVIGLYARILQVKNVKKGDSIGYGSAFIAKEDMKIALLGIGYANGLFKNHIDKYYTLIDNKKCPFIGKMSMEYNMIDVTSIYDKYLKVGSYIELIGENRTISKMAKDFNTNPGEIICRLDNEMNKIVINKSK